MDPKNTKPLAIGLPIEGTEFALQVNVEKEGKEGKKEARPSPSPMPEGRFPLDPESPVARMLRGPSQAEMELAEVQRETVEYNMGLTMTAQQFAMSLLTAGMMKDLEQGPESLARLSFKYAKAFMAERSRNMKAVPTMDDLRTATVPLK